MARSAMQLMGEVLKWCIFGFLLIILLIAILGESKHDQSNPNTADTTTVNQPQNKPQENPASQAHIEQCEKAFAKANKDPQKKDFKITSSEYYQIPPENPWKFRQDGSEIAITGILQEKNLRFMEGHQIQKGYFYCGIDKTTGKIDYLNNNGFDVPIKRLGQDGIARAPAKTTDAMIKFDKAQEDELQKRLVDGLFAECQINVKTHNNKSADIPLWGAKHVLPRLNDRGEWVTGVHWTATNAFGVKVHNRTWCIFEPKNMKMLNSEIETLKFEK